MILNSGIIFVSILVLIIISSNFVSASAISGSSTEFGSLNIDQDSVSISETAPTILNISGTVVDYNSGQMILIEIKKPDNTSITLKTQADKEGIFSTPILLDSNWTVGNYQLLATYLNNEIGSASFSITSVSVQNIPVMSNIGSLEIDEEEITVTGNEKSTVEVNGNIKNYQRGDPITLKILHPSGLTSDVTITGKSNGDFTAHISIADNWESGSFSIIASYDEENFGKVDFQLNKIQIPSYFKNVASWWSDGLIEDFEFVDGIEYLISEEIIEIPNLSGSAGSSDNVVPDWVRQNIGWWSNGFTSDTELVNSIQYLVEKGIIQVN
ncbi:hypothetical protein [Nitrosopumilus adriaticus]|uniref:hypothetical protein n=1 Tax=Nitrosopumilus adriaticus TaxID=1580092 RepID=UPI00352E4EC1